MKTMDESFAGCRTRHLSEVEIDDVLVGDARAACLDHLKWCAVCRAQVAELAKPIEAFAAVTLAWGEHQSAMFAARSAMPAARSAHLNEAEIDAVLIGEEQATSTEHLKECFLCQTQVARIAGPIHAFAAVTLAWGERQSATLAALPLRSPAGWTRQAGWAVASALLAAAVMVPTVRHRAVSTETSAGVQAVHTLQAKPVLTAAVPKGAPVHEARIAAAQIAAEMALEQAAPVSGKQVTTEMDRDNRMLEAIDDAWDAAPPSPAESFGFRAASGTDSQAHFAPL